MKKTIRILALLLCAIMMISLIAACGDNTGKENETTETVTPTEIQGPDLPDLTGTPPEETIGRGADVDEDIKLPAYELQDKVVRKLVNADEALSPQTLIFQENYTYNGEPAEMLFDITTHGEYMNKLITSVMTLDPPDIFSNDFDPSLINKNIVESVDTMIDFSTKLWAGTQKSHDRYLWNGKHYLVNPMFARWDVLWYNREIFENYGVETPDSLYEKGQWDWNTMRDAAMKLTIDENQDGVYEVFGIAIDDMKFLVPATGKSFVTFNDDGSVTNNMMSPEIARAMQFYVDLYVKDKCVYRGDDGRDKFVLSQIAMIVGGLWYRTPFQDMVRADKVSFVPYPKDPEADKYYCTEGANGFFIPKGARNPSGAAAYLSGIRFMYVDQEWLMADYDKVALDSGWTMREHEMLWNEVQGPKLNPIPDLSATFGVSSFNADIFVRTREGEPWATIAAEIAPMIQDNIDRLMSER